MRRLCWYVGEKYLRDLKAKEEFSPRVLESVEALADFLVSEARAMEHGTDHAKREAREQVPGDRVKDAPALARELRWRVKHAAGYSSEDEGRGGRKLGKTPSFGEPTTNGVGHKRKRSDGGEDRGGMFKNFTKRRVWEAVVEMPPDEEIMWIRARRPAEGEDWKARWGDWKELVSTEDGEWVVVESRKDVIVKVRKTEKGIERQRVERILEDWVWRGDPSATLSPAVAAKVEVGANEKIPSPPGDPAKVEKPTTNADNTDVTESATVSADIPAPETRAASNVQTEVEKVDVAAAPDDASAVSSSVDATST